MKVLDFGLAKAMEPTGASNANASMSPTISMHATQAGIILGTAAYMSPEQARGSAVDKRADLWAFGVVLYEMMTGTRLFDGATVSDTLAAVLKTEPDWTALPAHTPAPIRRLLLRCLEKDRKKRLADAADARLEIEDSLTASVGVGASPAVSRIRDRLWMGIALALLLGGASLAIPAWRHLREAPPSPSPETRTDIVTPATADPISFALSPDGRQIAFVASADGPSRLWLRSLGAETARPLSGTDGAIYPFWSPDSQSVGFFAENQLKRLDISGGSPQTLAVTNASRGGTWNRDGVILFGRGTTTPLFRISASGGEAVAVTRLDRQQSHRFPYFLPDGHHFLFYAQGSPETGGIYLGSLDAAATTRLTAADAAGVYVPSGWLLWARGGTLVAQRLDLQKGALTGDPVTVADGVAADSTTYASALSVSASGLLAYRSGMANRRQLRWFDRSGKSLGPLSAPDDSGINSPALSPDGRRVAVSRAVQGNTDVWLLDGTRTSRLTFDAGIDRFAVWSADGSRIVFDSSRKIVRNLYVKASSGAGNEEQLLESTQPNVPYDWSADGRFLLYLSIDPKSDNDLWILPLQGDRKPWPFLKTDFVEANARFSPDGRWVAYQSNESGRFEIYVRPFLAPGPGGVTQSGADGQWQVSTEGGIAPRWRPDGRELYYLGQDGQMMAARITVTGATLAPGAPVKLFDTRIYGGGVDNRLGTQYDVARDGRFLINTVVDEAVAPITLIQNWQPDGKK